jgi:voltage-gated potassium channel
MKETKLRNRIHEIIFEADTFAGKFFDIVLLIFILLSVAVVLLESLPDNSTQAKLVYYYAEWFFTIVFSIEYVLRIYSTKKPLRYIFSFYGIIDLLSVLPTYLSLFFAGSHVLAIIRMLRLLRVFRVLKLVQFLGASSMLIESLKRSRYKIGVFFLTVIILVTILGSIMYLVEGSDSGFTSIPRSIYWAIVTITTVGYGDIAPVSPVGQFIAAVIMLIGYAIIAVPTGIITSEIVSSKKKIQTNSQVCSNCNATGHDDDAEFCKYCGASLGD